MDSSVKPISCREEEGLHTRRSTTAASSDSSRGADSLFEA